MLPAFPITVKQHQNHPIQLSLRVCQRVNDLNGVVGTGMGQQFSTIQHHRECEGPSEHQVSLCEELSNQKHTPPSSVKNDKCQVTKLEGADDYLSWFSILFAG